PDQALEVRRRLAEARADHEQARARMPADQYARWFVLRRGDGRRQVRDLESPAGDWLEDVDAARTGIVVEGWLDVPTARDVPRTRRSDLPDSQVLLSGDGRPLVTRVTDRGWQGSQILVVANGSFLLNLPLVNHQHRILAGKLVDACGEPGEVAFLESGAEGLTVFEQEPDTAYPTGAELFTVWPLGAIALHLVALGILYCFAEFPIFGRPKTQYSLTPVEAGQAAIATVMNLVINVQRPDTPKGQSDFGSHVQALGELLRRGGDTQYAQARLNYYHQHVKRDSAASLSEPAGSTTTAPPAPVR
ncbi:MAG: hypothetical protein J5I93_10375, partial [Pirellulaceae bacterium]|nr:hypothetical protein [Pirellulaceae bacterium]